MGHTHSSKKHSKAFGIGIALNSVYVVIELFYGFSVNSSALIADAGHNVSDVLSLILAWVAIWVADKRPSGRYTYGLRKTTIMASMFNGILIIGAAGLIAWNAIQKFQNPVNIPGNIMMIVAAIGLVVNTGTAFLFYKDQKSDLNIKGAFLHMAADAGVTLGVLLGGLAIKYTELTWIDPVLALIIVVVILYSAWGLLSDSVNLALDAVPKGINQEEVKEFLEKIDCVEEVHDLHIWAMSTTETALTAHLVIPEPHTDQLLYDIREKLHDMFEITHTTLQVEKEWRDNTYRPFKN
ncbi:MAG TPA: cation diffusion facilitator family transporter [Flavobacteriaceae bacterium]|nr:cation diffusion facilitator family transporter [Flavobacteriaceae bacterium]